jgi:hypothetical protein
MRTSTSGHVVSFLIKTKCYSPVFLPLSHTYLLTFFEWASFTSVSSFNKIETTIKIYPTYLNVRHTLLLYWVYKFTFLTGEKSGFTLIVEDTTRDFKTDQLKSIYSEISSYLSFLLPFIHIN